MTSHTVFGVNSGPVLAPFASFCDAAKRHLEAARGTSVPKMHGIDAVDCPGAAGVAPPPNQPPHVLFFLKSLHSIISFSEIPYTAMLVGTPLHQRHEQRLQRVGTFGQKIIVGKAVDFVVL